MNKISCIVPTYNRGKVICDTIRQLLDQDYPPHEIIVIDQTRNYPPAVERELAGYSAEGKILWIGQMAPNASMARNTGALIAAGDILLFLDDDIIVDRDFLASHLANYAHDNCDAVAGQVLDGDRSVVEYRARTHHDPEWDSLQFPKNFAHRTSGPWMISSNLSIRRSVYLELGGMDEWYEKGAFREESDFAIRFYRSGRLFQFDPRASLYHLGQEHVPGGGSRSHSSVWGTWHHHVGAWYFTWGFAKPNTVAPMAWTHFRGLVLNRASLRNPPVFVAKVIMYLAAIIVARGRRAKGPRTLPRDPK